MVKIECITPRGFCKGVERALKLLDSVVSDKPFVLHDIVHNTQIVDSYKRQGVQFVDDINDIPDGATCVFSAHGVALNHYQTALMKKLKLIDATCPLVGKVHQQAQEFERQGRAVVIIGSKGHDEINGTIGHLSKPENVYVISNVADISCIPDIPVGVVTQTTWNNSEVLPLIAEIEKKVKDVVYKVGICNATTERQTAVMNATKWADTVLVVGDEKSANAKKLKEIATQQSKQGFIIEKKEDLAGLTLHGNIAITAAASAPEKIVQEVYQTLKQNVHQ